jgi:hypothetical protein
MNGENKLNISDKFARFSESIDKYIESKNFVGPSFSEEFKQAEEFDFAKLNALTKDDCFNYGYMLLQYADFIGTELSKTKSIVSWCEESLNQIYCNELLNMPQYTKHDIKIAAIIKENEIAKQINNWKMVAESRVNFLSLKESNIRKKADCLIEKGKRK